MRILIVDQLVPYPPTDGGRLRVFSLLRHISPDHEVSLITLHGPSNGEDGAEAYLGNLCTHVEFVGRRTYSSKREFRLRQLQGALKQEPMRYFTIFSDDMADRIRTLTENECFDVVDINRPYMAPYVDAISPNSRCRKFLTLHDDPYVVYRRMMLAERNRRAKLRFFFMDLLFLKQAMRKYARRFDKFIMVSEGDRDTFKQYGADLDIAVVPNGVDTKGYLRLTDQPATPTLLFVGKMNYPPNVDGALFFCQEVFPQIKQSIPDANLMIVGREPTSSVQALASDAVTVTGYVESVIPYYQESLVTVVPLRAGGGTRLKIMEAMALGRPVVSTKLGCEGLAVTHGENILIADNADDFAAQTIRLLNDGRLRQRLIANGRRLVETLYDWRAITQQLLQVYSGTESQPKAAP